jgi:SpoVK/Ycf46/Vps4 family AAA+-type ATPase
MRRPGRIDKEIELSIPSSAQRYVIVSNILEELNISIINDEESDLSLKTSVTQDNSISVLERLARVTHGMVAADLYEVVKEACFIQRQFSASNYQDSSSVDNSLVVEMNQLTISQEKPSIYSLRNSREVYHISDKLLFKAANVISPSAIKEVIIEVPSVRWTDIGGMDSVKQSLQEVILYNIYVVFVFPSYYK